MALLQIKGDPAAAVLVGAFLIGQAKQRHSFKGVLMVKSERRCKSLWFTAARCSVCKVQKRRNCDLFVRKTTTSWTTKTWINVFWFHKLMQKQLCRGVTFNKQPNQKKFCRKVEGCKCSPYTWRFHINVGHRLAVTEKCRRFVVLIIQVWRLKKKGEFVWKSIGKFRQLKLHVERSVIKSPR